VFVEKQGSRAYWHPRNKVKGGVKVDVAVTVGVEAGRIRDGDFGALIGLHAGRWPS